MSVAGFVDVLGAVGDFARVLAWPLVVLILGWRHRQQIEAVSAALAGRMANLQSAEVLGNKLTFSDKVEATTEDAESALESVGSLPPVPEGTTAALESTANVDPTAAVLNSWSRLEESVKEAAGRLGVRKRGRPNTLSDLKALKEANVLDDPLYTELLNLREVRNMTVHEHLQITPEAAKSFSRIAVLVSAWLDTKQ